MPIRPDIRSEHYGADWQRLSKTIREEVGHCECAGICGAAHLCAAGPAQGTLAGVPAPTVKPRAAQLHVAHKNRVPGDNRRENLIVLCASCHLRYDQAQHVLNRANTLRLNKREAIAATVLPLPLGESGC